MMPQIGGVIRNMAYICVYSDVESNNLKNMVGFLKFGTDAASKSSVTIWENPRVSRVFEVLWV